MANIGQNDISERCQSVLLCHAGQDTNTGHARRAARVQIMGTVPDHNDLRRFQARHLRKGKHLAGSGFGPMTAVKSCNEIKHPLDARM